MNDEHNTAIVLYKIYHYSKPDDGMFTKYRKHDNNIMMMIEHELYKLLLPLQVPIHRKTQCRHRILIDTLHVLYSHKNPTALIFVHHKITF